MHNLTVANLTRYSLSTLRYQTEHPCRKYTLSETSGKVLSLPGAQQSTIETKDLRPPSLTGHRPLSSNPHSGSSHRCVLVDLQLSDSSLSINLFTYFFYNIGKHNWSILCTKLFFLTFPSLNIYLVSQKRVQLLRKEVCITFFKYSNHNFFKDHPSTIIC